MIQRIQTVYLFIASMIMLSIFFFPLTVMADADGQYYQIDLFGIWEGAGEAAQKIESLLPLRFLVFVTAALSMVTIFFYKRRILQIRICIFNIMMLTGFYALFFFYFFHIKNRLSAIADLKITVVFPIVAVILVFLATRYIRKDEMMVRSCDRIR